VILKGKNGGKFAKLFHGLSFGMTFFSRVKVFSSCVFDEFSFSTFGFGVGLECKC